MAKIKKIQEPLTRTSFAKLAGVTLQTVSRWVFAGRLSLDDLKTMAGAKAWLKENTEDK